MISAKDEILNRIRAAAQTSAPEPDSVPRTYRQSGALDLSVLEDRLIDYGVRVYRCSANDVPNTIAQALANAGKTGLLIPAGFPQEALPADYSFDVDSDFSYAELDRAPGVLTGCALAIAETGTIVLRHSEQEGRRALTLIPDYHLCVVYADSVVATVPEGIRRAAAFAQAPITTVSGPSATSDIEMTRVKGVHGPRTLEVILVE